jgi:hypothetical protein
LGPKLGRPRPSSPDPLGEAGMLGRSVCDRPRGKSIMGLWATGLKVGLRGIQGSRLTPGHPAGERLHVNEVYVLGIHSS